MLESVATEPRMADAPRWAAGWLLALLLAAAAAYGYRLGAPTLLDDPNDAQYAEVAREMVETGEWMSPQLDYTLFLNKPPLAYWLITLSYHLFGINEFAARLPGVITGLVLLVIVWRLGGVLWDERTGVLAAGVLLGTAGVLLEVRQVRPDLLLTAAIAGALLAATRLALASPFASTRGGRLGLQLALAIGLLAKGMVGVVLPVAALVAAMLVAGNVRLRRELLTWRTWWLLMVLVVPWHVAAAWRHPGFTWDYVVNQHLLFFLDRKLPRDSTGIALWQFWMAFAIRLFPWTVFLPLAVVRTWPRTGEARARWAAGLIVGWLVAVMVLFSLTPSRLEHYAIPALPACALLLGRLFRQPACRWLMRTALVPLAAAGMAAPFVLPAIVGGNDWLAAVTGLVAVARFAGVVLAAGSVFALALNARPQWLPVPLITMMCAMVPLMQRGLILLAPFNSSAPLAAVIRAVAAEGDTLVYEAPVEYQSVAGLCFYTQRKWLMLRPAGFVPPPYLTPHESELFITRDEFSRRWQNERMFLVSDPLAEGRASMKGVVPEPFWIVARSGPRWIVSNERP